MLRLPEPRAEGLVSRDGVGLHYQVFGEGPRAILLLPTWSIVHSDFWRHQVPHLASRYTVVAFDGRGNGGSDRPTDAAAYAETAFADDALACSMRWRSSRPPSCLLLGWLLGVDPRGH